MISNGTFSINTSGLVAYWRFKEGTGTTAHDYSGSDNHGTLHNGSVVCYDGDCPTWTEGKYGSALSFDGTNDYVEIPYDDSLNITEQVTVAAWVKPDLLDTWRGIVAGSKTDLNSFLLQTINGGFEFALKTTENSWAWVNKGGYSAGNWYHVVGVYDKNSTQNNLRLYVNGELVAQATISGYITGNGNNKTIGMYNYGNDRVFDGIIDEVMIWSRVLSYDEIKMLYSMVFTSQLKIVICL